jgi:hypothetical protein
MIAAYLTGNLPDESCGIFMNRLNESEDSLMEFNAFQKIWNLLSIVDDSHKFNAQNAHRLFKEQINAAKKISRKNRKV